MKKTNRVLHLLLVLALILSMLAACGQGETTDTPAKETTAKATNGSEETKTESSEKDEPTDEKVLVRILSGTQTEEVEGALEREMAEAYMALHPNVTIEYIPTTANDATTEMMAMIGANDIPEAFVMFDELAPVVQEEGLVQDLLELMDDDYVSGFMDAPMTDVMFDDQMLTFPWFIVPTATIYRTDWLEETGLDVPTTWDEFTEVAKAMTKDTNGDGTTDQWGFSMVGTNNGSGQSRFFNIARNFGAVDANLTDAGWETCISQPEFKEALQYFTDLYLVHGAVPPGPTEAGYTEAVNYLATERTGMMVTGSNGMGLLLNMNPDLDGKLGSFVLPKAPGAVGAQAGAVGYSISTTASDAQKAALVDFFKFMVNPENAGKFAAATGRMPCRYDAADHEIFQAPTYAGFVEAIDLVFFPQNFPERAKLWDEVGKAYTDILANDVSVDDAMKDLMEAEVEMLESANE